MAKEYGATNLIGGAAGSLDYLDGDLLSDGDAATVFTDSGVYHYHLNATSGAAENSPYVISPDTNPGTKRWLLVTPQAPFSHVSAGTTAATQTMVSGADTLIKFDDELHDKLSEYNPSTGVFTAKNDGLYHVVAQASCASTSTISIMKIYKNGGFYSGGTRIDGPYSSGIIVDTIELVTNDYIDIRMQIAGASVNLISESKRTRLMIDRIA